MFDRIPNTFCMSPICYIFISQVIEPRDYYKKVVDSVIANFVTIETLECYCNWSPLLVYVNLFMI